MGAGAPARAEQPVKGEGEELSEDDFLPEYDPLLPWHWLEASGGLTGLLNYNHGEVHFRGGLVFEALFLPAERQELRLGAYSTFAAGLWGDTRHGGFSPEVGGLTKLSAMHTELFDIYTLMGAGYMWGHLDDGHDALHLRAGVGARVMRAIAFEIAGSALYGSFDSAGETVDWVPGSTLQFTVNVCAFYDGCNYEPPRQRTVDRTCELYDRANQECGRLKQKEDLCKALDNALDAEANPPPVSEDAVSGYLEVVSKDLKADCSAPTSAEQALICRLRRNHAELREWLLEGRRRERHAARRDRELSHPWRYEPYPVALRRALGCGYPSGCLDVCESRDEPE
jgi:hypothetical protein